MFKYYYTHYVVGMVTQASAEEQLRLATQQANTQKLPLQNQYPQSVYIQNYDRTILIVASVVILIAFLAYLAYLKSK